MLEWDLALSLKATTMSPVADVFFAAATTSIWGPLRRLRQAVGQGGARGEPALPGRQAGGQVKAAVKLVVQGDLARQGKLALNATAERSPRRAVAPAALVVARGWWGVLVLAKVN